MLSLVYSSNGGLPQLLLVNMAHILRAGLRAPARTMLSKKSLFSAGAIAAAGLAVFHHKSPGSIGLHDTRYSVTPSWILVPYRHFRSQATLATSSLFSSSISEEMASLTPPQPPPTWTHSPEDVLRITKEQIQKHKASLDKIGALKEEESNFATVRRVFDIHL